MIFLNNLIIDQSKVDRIVGFIQELKHTKGEFHGKPFLLFDWQYEILKNVYGTIKPNGYRQYRNCYMEMPKKCGKSELLAALGLYQLCADGEWNAEVYGCADDKQQASIIFDVAVEMVDQNKTLKKVIKPIISIKRLVYLPKASFYQVCSAEAYSKHGLNISCCLFDEIHAQPNRELYDVMTFGSGDARTQPLFFFITTAGNDPDRMSIGWEVHKNAEDVLLGKSNDKTTYAAIWGLDPENNRIWTGQNYIQKDKIDWQDRKLWHLVNPSIGKTIEIERIYETFDKINGKIAEEKLFKQLRLNIWLTEKYSNWITIDKWLSNSHNLNIEALKYKKCFGGLDLSSKLDISAFVLIFPPDNENDKYTVLPYFWLPQDNISTVSKKDKIKYEEWIEKGLLRTTPGDKIDYHTIVNDILELRKIYDFDEIGFDPWNADAVATDLQYEGLIMVEVRPTYQFMSPVMYDVEALIHSKSLNHMDNEILTWMFNNLRIIMDANGNIKPAKSIKQGSRKETIIKKAKIDGIVAMLTAFCRVFADNGNSEIHI